MENIKYYRFKALYQSHHWIAPAFVGVDHTGNITYLSVTKPKDVDTFENVEGLVLPGFPNAHSHAFQYAMAGIAEKHDLKGNSENFWSWREIMYKLALRISPEHLEAIASMLYTEMLRHGYTSVVEFHYLHHTREGVPYENLSEMGERLVAAAQKTGMKITLVPVFYQKGGFGKAPTEQQRRFVSKSVEEYYQLLESTQKTTTYYDDAHWGIGVHSLRAVEPDLIPDLLEAKRVDVPFHIHIAEQQKEVDEALKYLDATPVEWLLENAVVNEQFHLIHSTHVTLTEVKNIVFNGANVVLCPSTEGNLGDGVFPLFDFQEMKGRWSVGTDSHVGLNPLEELRLLDYGQRVKTHKRNTFHSKDQGDSGRFALDQMIFTGRKATGTYLKEFARGPEKEKLGYKKNVFFEEGKPFDAVVFDANFPLFAATSFKKMTSTIIYSGDVSTVLGTITNGVWRVKNQQHIAKEQVSREFQEAIQELSCR